MPPNYGASYTTEFSDMYPQLAKAQRTSLVPFMLENVAAKPELIQDDGCIPTQKASRLFSTIFGRI